MKKIKILLYLLILALSFILITLIAIELKRDNQETNKLIYNVLVVKNALNQYDYSYENKNLIFIYYKNNNPVCSKIKKTISDYIKSEQNIKDNFYPAGTKEYLEYGQIKTTYLQGCFNTRELFYFKNTLLKKAVHDSHKLFLNKVFMWFYYLIKFNLKDFNNQKNVFVDQLKVNRNTICYHRNIQDYLKKNRLKKITSGKIVNKIINKCKKQNN